MKKEESRVKKEEFITKRAEGKSFDTISNELGVSTETLIKWNLELDKEIDNLKEIRREKLIEKYKAGQELRLEAFLKIREKLLDKIENINIDRLDFVNTLKYLMVIEKAINGNLDLTLKTDEKIDKIQESYLDMEEGYKEIKVNNKITGIDNI